MLQTATIHSFVDSVKKGIYLSTLPLSHPGLGLKQSLQYILQYSTKTHTFVTGLEKAFICHYLPSPLL